MCNTEDKLECVTWKLYKTQCFTGRRFGWVNREEWRGRGTRVLRRRRELCCCCCCCWSRSLTAAKVNLVVQWCASGLSTWPVVHSLLVWIYCLRDLSSELTTFSDFHNARKSYGLVVNSIGGKNLLCGTYFLRHAHFRYNLLSIHLSFTQLLSSILRLPGGLLLIISPDMSL